MGALIEVACHGRMRLVENLLTGRGGSPDAVRISRKLLAAASCTVTHESCCASASALHTACESESARAMAASTRTRWFVSLNSSMIVSSTSGTIAIARAIARALQAVLARYMRQFHRQQGQGVGVDAFDEDARAASNLVVEHVEGSQETFEAEFGEAFVRCLRTML